MARIHQPGLFADAMQRYFEARGLRSPTRASLRDNFHRWFSGDTAPDKQNQDYLCDFFDQAVPSLKPFRLFLAETTPLTDVLLMTGLTYTELKANNILTDVAETSWNNRYDGLKFMEVLSTINEENYASEKEESDRNRAYGQQDDPVSFDAALSRRQRGRARMLGLYYLYRYHSVLSGILREIVSIDRIRYDRWQGTYFQYHKSGEKSTIPFDVFDVGFYTISIGSHRHSLNPKLRRPRANRQSSDQSEILTVSIIKRSHKLIIEDEKTKRDKEIVYHAGLLSGVYDDAETLLAERVLLMKVSDDPQQTPDEEPERLGESSDEMRWYGELLSNRRDGQVLSMRQSRLEEMLLRYRGF
jgi:hypothetical protein